MIEMFYHLIKPRLLRERELLIYILLHHRFRFMTLYNTLTSRRLVIGLGNCQGDASDKTTSIKADFLQLKGHRSAENSDHICVFVSSLVLAKTQ